jgi:hypothetical protein
VAAGSLVFAGTLLLAPVAGQGARWIDLVGILCAVAASSFVGFHQWRVLRPRRSEGEAARMLAGERPEVGELLVTGADLARWGEAGTRERGASGVLVAAEVEAAALAAGDLPVGAAVPIAPFLSRAGLAAGALAVLAGVFLYGPKGGSAGLAELAAAGTGGKIAVGNLVLTVAPPAYTGLETVVEDGAEGDVRGYPGSRVTLAGRLSAEAVSGQWEGPGGERIPLEIDGSAFTVSWVLKEAGKYRLVFRRGLRPAVTDFAPRTITLLADERPEVELLLPEGDLDVSAAREVEVRFRASDDFAVERAQVVLQGAEEVRLPLSVTAGKRVQGGLKFLPLSYPQIGDGAYLRVEVRDNDTVNGPKSGVSRSVYLVVQSRKRMQAEMETYEERLFEAMLGYLGDHLETPAVEGEAAEKLVRGGEDLLRLLDAVTEKAALGQEEGFLGALAFTRVAAPLRTAVERFFAERAAAAAALVAELERDILFLDDSLRELRMDEALSMGEDLQAIQRDLFDRLRRGEDAGSLMKAVDEIERLLQEMGRKLSRESGELPDSFANSDAVKEMPRSGIEQMIEELREALRAGDRKKASELAEKVLNELSRWMEDLNKAADETMKSSDSPLRKEIEELLDRVSKGVAEQERMMSQTREAGDAASRRTLEAFQAMREDFFRLQEDRLLEVEQRVREVDMLAPQPSGDMGPGAPPPPSEEAWDEMLKLRNDALDGVRQTRQSLRDSLGEALDAARRLEDAVKRHGGMVGVLLAEAPAERRKAEESANLGAKAAEAVARDIESLLESRKERLDPLERRKLAELGGEEERLGREIEDIGAKLGDLAKKTPVIGPGLEEAAREGAREARGAGTKLGQGDPFAALPGERRVVEKLSEISQELGQLGQQLSERPGGRGERAPGGRGGREIDKSRVEIPAETEAREWRAFREEVLRAMRERDYPKEYEKEVERYYERLIR